MAITSANQLELLQTAEAVAREKMIDPALVIEAMEESLAKIATNVVKEARGPSVNRSIPRFLSPIWAFCMRHRAETSSTNGFQEDPN